MLLERSWPAAVLAMLLASGVACSSSSSSRVTPAPAPVCPASYDLARAGTCNAESERCDFVVACGTFDAPVSCVCAGGSFVCMSSAITADASTSDPCAPADPPPACPATERLASVVTCTALGQQCAYPSACASIPAFDQCQCVAGRTINEGPHYECTASCDVSDASAPDARAIQGGDAGSPADARAPDATFNDGQAVDAAPPLDGASGQ